MSAAQNGRGAHQTSSQSFRFFEKAAPALQTIRRSTPDSEALASSDDDHDHPMSKSAHSLQSGQGIGMPKPARRPSWLSEVQSGTQRKFSIGSASSLQHSQPSTPSAEAGPTNWGTTGPRPPGSAGAYPWAGGWTMAPSAMMPEGVTAGLSTSAIDDAQPLMSPTADEFDFVDDASSYPFNVSYTPVRKNVRSQSYSAGQQQPSDERGSGVRGTGRVAHRPSRPSMLGEGGSGRPALGLVMEDEDDEPVTEPTGYMTGTAPRTGLRQDQMLPHNVPNASLLKQAAVENALSKQRHSQITPVTSPAESYHAFLGQMPHSGSHNTREPWNEGDEGPSNSQFPNEASPGGKSMLSRHATQPTWSSNLGFGEVIQPSESRRASFADPRSGVAGVPRTRTMSSSQHSEDTGSVFSQKVGHALTAENAFQQQQQHSALNPYAVPQTFSTPTPDLFIVAFKCARAGTFYVPANTGLEVKVGDNVIVEGDRGIDLGTVTHAQVSLAEAKQLTQAAKDAHFKWLMMFSKTKQVQPGSSVGMLTAGPDEPPTAGSGRSQQPNPKAEDRPKMIRSIATHHQIQQLREKEGAEAKAKRVAQVKVGEHQLEMEILDAEMQYDWKKLTFFFYSPKYVNFNNLVIDLFKIYKTRIWMDAITNGTSQAAQDEVLGGAGPVVASSSQPAMPPHTMRDVLGGEVGKKSSTRLPQTEPDIYSDIPSLTNPYSTAGTSSSPLQPSFGSTQQAYTPMSHINPAYAGSPPLSGSAYSPYDQTQSAMGFQNPYSSFMMSPSQQGGSNAQQWAWKYMQSPPSATSPSWTNNQHPNQPQPSMLTGGGLPSHAADAQRSRPPATDAEQLTAYLRNLAINTPR